MKRIKSFWSNLSIRSKLLIYFFVIIFFVSAFNVYLNNNNYKTMDQFNETMTNYYMINELLVKTQSNKRQLDNFIRNRDQEQLAVYQTTELEINQLIEDLYERFTSREAYFSMNAIKNSVASYQEFWKIAIEQRQNEVESYYLAQYRGEDIYEYTEGYIQELLYVSLREGNSLYNELAAEAEVMRRISLFLIVGVFLFALIFAALFSNYIVRPIKDLATASRQMAEGNLDVNEVHIGSKDEVGVLADSFNTMSSSIRDYVEDLKQKVVIEKKLHEEEMAIIRMEHLLQASEFQALQSQVNPHFLFNTLNTISRTAMFEKADDTVKLIQALSNLQRYRVKNSEQIVSLEEEMWLINEYIYLQKMRFKDRLNFVVALDGDLSAIEMPVFTLQPLIENSIIHGIEPKIEGGTVRIKIRYKVDKTVITITDTGMGITQEQLAILVNKSRLKTSDRIGVANVYNRFKLHYGNRGHFRMYSKKGMGTMIRLTIDKEIANV